MENKKSVQSLQFRMTITSLLIGIFLSALDSTVISTATPAIVADLGDAQFIAWIVSAYLTCSTAALPLYGKASDMIGRRLPFFVAQILFFVGSVGAGLATNMPLLLVCRAVQGAGAGGFMGLNNIVLSDWISPRERGRYSAYFGLVYAVASVLGPLAGGLSTDYVSWRFVFFLNIPFCVLLFALSFKFLHDVRSFPIEASNQEEGSRAAGCLRFRVDVTGGCLVVSFVVVLMLALTWGGAQFAWSHPLIVALLLMAVALLLAFALNEMYVPVPILPLSLFRDRTFVCCNINSCVVGMGTYIALTFIPIFLHDVQQYSATSTGLMILPILACFVVSTICAGKAFSKTGRYVWIPRVTMCLMAIGSLTLAVGLSDSFSYGWMLAAMFCLGTAVGSCMTILVVAVQNAADAAHAGPAATSVSFFRTLAGAIGVSVAQSIVQYEYDRISPSSAGGIAEIDQVLQGDNGLVAAARARHDYALAIGASFWFLMAAALIAVVASAMMPNLSLRSKVEQVNANRNEEEMLSGTEDVPDENSIRDEDRDRLIAMDDATEVDKG